MKKLFTVLAVTSLLSGIAVAQDGPTIEPGPVQELSGDATLVSRILLDRQVKDCVAEIQDSVYDVSLSKVTFQALAPGKTKYQFSGVALEGGDIAVGQAVLTVMETEQDGVFGSVEAVKTVSDLFMPLAGKVTAFNEDLEDNPESVNDDPYGAGWLIKITLDDPSQVAELLSAADYAAMVGH